MAKYNDDRSFTDFVHNNLAVPIIYKKLKWDVSEIDADELQSLDINNGIDYVLEDNNGKSIYVQERFRDEFYKSYNDATLRFRRDFNPDPKRVESEFYKIKADFLVYGITNGKKFIDKRHTLTDFIKWVALDLKFIQNKYQIGKIKIVTPTNQIKCWIEGDILCCPENFNPDGSSSFLPFDINLMKQLWGSTPILDQKGFL
jgi:hypothetical protein